MVITSINANEAAFALGLLRLRFPELGTSREMNGADTVEALCELHKDLKATVRSKKAQTKRLSLRTQKRIRDGVAKHLGGSHRKVKHGRR